MLAEQFRNDETLFSVIPTKKKSRHPGKCEAFVRDPGKTLVPHVDSLDSGHCCATAQQFRNDEMLAEQFRNDETLFSVIPTKKKSRHPGKCEAFVRDPGKTLVPHVDSLDSGHCCATAQQFRNDEMLAEQFRNDATLFSVIPAGKKSRHPGKCEAFVRDPGNALVPYVDSLGSGHCCATAQQCPEWRDSLFKSSRRRV